MSAIGVSSRDEPQASDSTKKFAIYRANKEGISAFEDLVAQEEPLDIRIQYRFKDQRRVESFALAMRTPGADHYLVAGLLYSEGVINQQSDLQDIRSVGGASSREFIATLAPGVDVEEWRLRRSSAIHSGCGLCGKVSAEQVVQSCPVLEPADKVFTLDRSLLLSLPYKLEKLQGGFASTGSLHAAALIDGCGEIEAVFEDVGRHNALDKLIGWCLSLDRLPLTRNTLLLTSRSSYELVQKAARAGAPILASVGGPSSGAIELARACDLTLVGFLRDSRCNIYASPRRLNSR